MASCSNDDPKTVERNDEQKFATIRDLQSLLRKTIGNEVTVASYATSLLLPLGEHFSSTMLKVEVLIEKSKKGEREKLNLVAKMIPTSEFHKTTFNIAAIFYHEIFIYEKLMPAYRKLEEAAGVEVDAMLDVTPRYYGGRLTLSDDSGESRTVDENTVILMENLKESGYYVVDRMIGLDYEHAKVATSELAHFHALGMATKLKNPDIFEKARECMDSFVYNTKREEYVEIAEHTIKLVCEDARVARYEERIRKSIDVLGKGYDDLTKMDKVEPWVTIVHGDFWVSNMMFRKEHAKLDVKFIDFQNVRIGSPLKDLPNFLLVSCSDDTIDKHFDDLLDIYYSKFVDTLKELNQDVSFFTRENFDAELKKVALSELFHGLIITKFLTYEPDDNANMDEMKASVMLSGANSRFFDGGWRLISKFNEKNWMLE